MINVSDIIKGFLDRSMISLYQHIKIDKPAAISGVINGNLAEKVEQSGIYSDTIERNSYTLGYLDFIYKRTDAKPVEQYAELFDELCPIIKTRFNEYLTAVGSDVSAEEYELENMWLIIQKEGDYASLHHHKPNDYAGILYLEKPAGVNKNTFPNGMMIVLNNEHSIFSIPPEPGTLYFWPGGFLHSVYPFRGAGDKVAIAFNIILKSHD